MQDSRGGDRGNSSWRCKPRLRQPSPAPTAEECAAHLGLVCVTNGTKRLRRSAYVSRCLGSSGSAYDLPAGLIEIGGQRPAAANPARRPVAQLFEPRLRLMGIARQQRLVMANLVRGKRRPFLAKGHHPDTAWSFRRPMPADNPRRVRIHQQIQGLGGESPIIGRMIVDVKIKWNAQEQHPIRPQDTPDLINPAPEMRHVLQSTHGYDG